MKREVIGRVVLVLRGCDSIERVGWYSEGVFVDVGVSKYQSKGIITSDRSLGNHSEDLLVVVVIIDHGVLVDVRSGQ